MSDRRPTALVADDEPLLRESLVRLLAQAWPELEVVAQVRNGRLAVESFEALKPHVCFLDVHMPGLSGVEAARFIGRRAHVVFVTAYDQYAVQAFELNAVDYLLKPVRAQRLAAALEKARRGVPVARETLARLSPEPRRHLSVSERGRILLVPLADVLYLKAELKYVTVRTREREYLLDESLTRLEEEFAARFVRVHRNCLVAREAITGFEKDAAEDGETHWSVLLAGLDEKLPVSRRQWPAVKAAFAGEGKA